MTALEKAVEKNPNAIAVTGVASAHKRDFKILQLEGKDPNFENIRTGNYLLYRPLFLVSNQNAPNSARADEFIKFALGAEGREIIRQNQVVPYFDGMLLLQKRSGKGYLCGRTAMRRSQQGKHKWRHWRQWQSDPVSVAIPLHKGSYGFSSGLSLAVCCLFCGRNGEKRC